MLKGYAEKQESSLFYKAIIKYGSKVKFISEKGIYTVKAVNSRFVILTKPFNPKRTVIYTIIDWERGVRGPNNLVFNIYDYKEQSDINECLNDLITYAISNDTNCIEVSYRKCIPLDIESVDGIIFAMADIK